VGSVRPSCAVGSRRTGAGKSGVNRSSAFLWFGSILLPGHFVTRRISLILLLACLATELPPIICQSLSDASEQSAFLWKKMKEALLSPTGSQYFEKGAKN